MDPQQEKNPPGLPIMPTGETPRPRKRSTFGRLLGRGLAVLLPTLLTLIILLWAYGILDNYIAQPINHGLQVLIAPHMDQATLDRYIKDLPPEDRIAPTDAELMGAYWDDHWYLHFVGMAVALLLLLIVGFLVSSFIGRAVWRVFERGILRIPLIKQVYPYVKQVTDFVLSERPLEVSRVVMVEYPRKDCWSLGFVTSRGLATLHSKTGRDLVAIFVPSSPTPVTGYVIQVPREDVIDVPLSVDQALRFTITGGVVTPEGEVVQHQPRKQLTNE